MEDKYLHILKSIILTHIDKSKHSVYLFGSRTRGKANQSVDVDIGIWGENPLETIYHSIINDIEESIIPYDVDIIDLYLTSEEFRKHALKDAILWHRPMN